MTLCGIICDTLADKKTIFNSRLFKCGFWYLSDLRCNKILLLFDTWLNRGCIKTDFIIWMQIVDNVKKRNYL